MIVAVGQGVLALESDQLIPFSGVGVASRTQDMSVTSWFLFVATFVATSGKVMQNMHPIVDAGEYTDFLLSFYLISNSLILPSYSNFTKPSLIFFMNNQLFTNFLHQGVNWLINFLHKGVANTMNIIHNLDKA